MSYIRTNRPVWFSLVIQLVVVLPIVLVLSLFGSVPAYSGALGAAVYIVPNAYFTHYAFQYRFNGVDDNAARCITRSFNRGEFGKLALVMAGFAFVFRFASPLNVPALFTGFCSMVVCQWSIAAGMIRHLDVQVRGGRRGRQ